METTRLKCKCLECRTSWTVIARKDDDSSQRLLNCIQKCRTCGSNMIEVKEVKRKRK